MYAGLNVVIYNAFETERGGVCGDDIAYQKMEREREREREKGRVETAKRPLYNG